MKNETKEILEGIASGIYDSGVIYDIDIKALLDYIDELEKECIRLKEIAYNLTTVTVCGDIKQIKNTAQYKLEIAQQRIDKAIEYIKKTQMGEGYQKEIIDILRGEDNE